MSVFRKSRIFVISLLVPILLVLVLNSALNRHMHLVSGFSYTHAHPFQQESTDSPIQSHSHSILELVMLDILSDLEIIISFIIIGLFVYLYSKKLKAIVSPKIRQNYRLALLNPRAPPEFI